MSVCGNLPLRSNKHTCFFQSIIKHWLLFPDMAEVEEREPALTGTAKENGDGPSRKKRIWKLSKQKRRQVLQTIVLYLGFFALVSAFIEFTMNQQVGI